MKVSELRHTFIAITLPNRMLANSLTIFFFFSLLSATFDRIAEINFNLDADDNSVSVFQERVILILQLLLSMSLQQL